MAAAAAAAAATWRGAQRNMSGAPPPSDPPPSDPPPSDPPPSDPPPSDQMRAAGSAARRKAPLPPGRSQLHWLQRAAQLPPRPPPRPVSVHELARHNRPRSAWLALHGTVYDVSHYVHFHPGGHAVLLAVAGKDASAQFDRLHPWVNAHFMLQRCIVGPLCEQDHDQPPSAPTSASP